MGLLLGFIALQLYISWHAYCISNTIILLFFQICNAIAISQKLCAPPTKKKQHPLAAFWQMYGFSKATISSFLLFTTLDLPPRQKVPGNSASLCPFWGRRTVSKVGIVTSNEPFGLNHLGIYQQLLLEDMVNIPIIYRVYSTSKRCLALGCLNHQQ